MKRIKVVRVIARLNIGGPAIHTILLTAGLNRRRFESLLVSGIEAEHEGNMLTLAAAKGVQPLIITELGREIDLRRDAKVLVRLYHLFREEGAQIVHTHTAKAGFLGRLAARLAGSSVVLHTFHGHVFCGYFSPPKTRLFIWIERFLTRLSDCIVTVSQGQRQELARYGIAPLEKIAVIPLGFELKPLLTCHSLRGQLRQELGFGEETRLVGIVARLTPIKNHQLFLEAARIVSVELPTTRFLVIGDGELRGRLEEEAERLGISDKVLFLGWRRDLPRLYADLDVVALCSINEGTPVSIIEAMAAARPAVATAVGGVPEIVQDFGLLVPSGDAQAMAEAITWVLQNPIEAETMARAAQEWVYPRFTASRLVADIERLYQNLLDRKGMIRD
ncbi:MAG: glycosyltransferase [Anaerolineae bacterium]